MNSLQAYAYCSEGGCSSVSGTEVFTVNSAVSSTGSEALAMYWQSWPPFRLMPERARRMPNLWFGEKQGRKIDVKLGLHYLSLWMMDRGEKDLFLPEPYDVFWEWLICIMIVHLDWGLLCSKAYLLPIIFHWFSFCFLCVWCQKNARDFFYSSFIPLFSVFHFLTGLFVTFFFLFWTLWSSLLS